jgi:CO/xanthine dehydrogenase FAD-binding subunit
LNIIHSRVIREKINEIRWFDEWTHARSPHLARWSEPSFDAIEAAIAFFAPSARGGRWPHRAILGSNGAPRRVRAERSESQQEAPLGARTESTLGMRTRFAYLRPHSPQEAVELKSRYGARARFWAGGTDLMLLWEAGEVALEYCIDLTFLERCGQIDSDSHRIRIGSLVTLDALDAASTESPPLRALGDTARLMCTPQTRTIATIGGNVCHASPSADLPPLLIALDARVRLLGASGERVLPIEEFPLGVNRTAIADDEMLVAIEVPIPVERREASYRRIARTVVDIALVGAAVAITVDDRGVIADARVALGSVAPIPIRSRGAEEVLIGKRLEGLDRDVLERSGMAAVDAGRPISDVRAGADYRREMCAVLTRRAIGDCVQRLGGHSA